MTAKVEIYGTTNCRKCVDVRAVLDRYGVEYIDHLIDLMPHEKDEMAQRCGLRYYPQVFIDDQHIGGEEALILERAVDRFSVFASVYAGFDSIAFFTSPAG